MTELEFFFRTELKFSVPVSEHVFQLHCLPIEDEAQQLQSLTLCIDPAVPYTVQRDGFGAQQLCGSVLAPHRQFYYEAQGLVRVDLSRRSARPPHPMCRQPTALTAPGREIRALWDSLALEGISPQETAERLNHAVFASLRYQPGSTNTATTAEAALAQGCGVCQDATHLLLALARLSGIPARYCMGLIPGEGATHAWAELALPGGWQGFDPTHDRPTGEDYLRFALGRDAADCPAEKGVFRGIAAQTQTVSMRLGVRP